MTHLEPLQPRRLLAVYYVDPDGSDANDGLSPQAAWQTIGRVNGFTFASGDSVLFEGGSRFAGNLSFGPDDAGSAAAPIVVGSYTPEDGADPAASSRATIDAGTGDGLYALNTAGFLVTRLNFVGSNQSPYGGSGIRFKTDLPGDVKLPRVHVHDVEVQGFGNYGITVGGRNGKSGFSDVRITQARVHHNLVGGIEIEGEFSRTSKGYANRDVYIGHCEVYENTGFAGSLGHVGSGIVVSDVDGAVIERCVSHHNGQFNTHVGGPIGIWAWDANNVVIQHNESHHNRTSSTADGGGFDLDGGVTNSVMQYNYSHDNDGAGYGLFQFPGARPFGDNVVRFNVSENDGRRNGYAGIQLWSAGYRNRVRDVQIYHNTVYTGRAAHGTPRAIYFQGSTADVTVRNNIFQTEPGVTVAEVRYTQPGLRFEGNNYHSGGGLVRFRRNARLFGTFSTWRAATGYERHDKRLTGSSVDPMLTNGGAGGTVGDAALLESLAAYRLRPGSPLAGAGLNLWAESGTDPGRRDFFGTPLPATAEEAASFRYGVGAHSPVT